ncbi:hypothetical protein WKV53_13590 [Luteolibacter sp. Y139]|uniref:Uncharacterized protein n=1 Tax=Luteolibacter soli TaxID=3135280 RepID=A0ABU9AVI9_9BACT
MTFPDSSSMLQPLPPIPTIVLSKYPIDLTHAHPKNPSTITTSQKLFQR